MAISLILLMAGSGILSLMCATLLVVHKKIYNNLKHLEAELEKRRALYCYLPPMEVCNEANPIKVNRTSKPCNIQAQRAQAANAPVNPVNVQYLVTQNTHFLNSHGHNVAQRQLVEPQDVNTASTKSSNQRKKQPWTPLSVYELSRIYFAKQKQQVKSSNPNLVPSSASSGGAQWIKGDGLLHPRQSVPSTNRSNSRSTPCLRAVNDTCSHLHLSNQNNSGSAVQNTIPYEKRYHNRSFSLQDISEPRVLSGTISSEL